MPAHLPQTGEYNEYYQRYIDLVSDLEIAEAFDSSGDAIEHYIKNVPAHRENYAYGPGKWTIKQALQHVIDTERIFQTRALRVARNDATPQPGFDQNLYAAQHGTLEHTNLKELLHEFKTVRESSRCLFARFRESELTSQGVASDSNVSTRALAYMIAGHAQHHANLYHERYK